MDPEANLTEQRALARDLMDAIDHAWYIDPEKVNRLAELVVALDAWLRNGGFLPVDWRGGRS